MRSCLQDDMERSISKTIEVCMFKVRDLIFTICNGVRMDMFRDMLDPMGEYKE